MGVRINQERGRIALAFVVGLIFALGLALSGMSNPDKVLGFLVVGPNWDPTLLFVMGGAIPFHAFVYRSIKHQKMDQPIINDHYSLPTLTQITPQLVIGATIFGIGWGIAGLCPGPGIISIGTGNSFGWIFIPSMITGMYLHRLYIKMAAAKK